MMICMIVVVSSVANTIAMAVDLRFPTPLLSHCLHYDSVLWLVIHSDTCFVCHHTSRQFLL